MIDHTDQLATKGIEYVILIVYLVLFFGFWNLFVTRERKTKIEEDSASRKSTPNRAA